MDKRKRFERVCKYCGQTFIGKVAQVYCGHECTGKAKRKTKVTHCRYCGQGFIGKAKQVYCNQACMAKDWQNQKVAQCKHCGAVFSKRISLNRVYCSRACYWASGRVSTTCTTCGKAIIRQKNTLALGNPYCSEKCGRKNQSVIMKAMRPKAPLVPTECAYCGKALKRIRGQILRAKRQFCNNTCHGQWLYEYGPKAEAHPCWTGGEVEYRGPNWNAQSEAARARDNYCCQYCGLSQENHRRALDVHHIIPFRDFKYIPGENNRYLEANDLSNLITLCPVCHKKAEFGKIEI